MTSVVVTELGVAPWAFGLGLKGGATIDTLTGIDEDLINQLFKYQTFLKKCEDALAAQNLTVLKPITTISNVYTARYTPTDRNAFKQIPMTEFAGVSSNWGLQFTTIWQRFYEYAPSTGGKLYFRLDFGISGKFSTTSTVAEFYETTAYRLTVGTAVGSNDIENVIGQRYFPHVPDRSSTSYTHSKIVLSTNFHFAATKDSVFFSFGGYRAVRYGLMDGRLATATIPNTIASGPVFTPVDVYSADVPKVNFPSIYFPPILGTGGDSSPPSSMTCTNSGFITSANVDAYAKIITPNGVYSTANTGILSTELRNASGVGRVYGMPFTMAISSGMLVAQELMLFTDPDISTFNVAEYPFYVGENPKKILRIPFINQTVSGYSAITSISFSYSVPDTIRATGQTSMGLLLDGSTIYY